MSEIPIEKLPAALAARLDCPVCDGNVRLTLGTNAPGDICIWACDSCNSEWYENGKPRWQIELSVDVAIREPADDR